MERCAWGSGDPENVRYHDEEWGRPVTDDNRLFENRDLAPTLDVRSVFKGVLRDHMGVDRAALDRRVFPGSAAEAPAYDGLV